MKTTSRALSIGLALMLALSLLAVMPLAAAAQVGQNDMGSGTDAGDSIGQALTISPPVSGEGYIDYTDTADCYQFYVSSGATINISMTPPSGADFDIDLYDPSQYNVDWSWLGGSQTDSISYDATQSGTWYLRVGQYTGSGTYSMSVSTTSTGSQNDMGSGTDAGDTMGQALTISSTASGTGYLDSDDYYDYYKFNVSSGATINISMTPPSGADFDIDLYDPSQYNVDWSWLGGSQTDSISYDATQSGTWYLRVGQYTGSGTYSMSVATSTDTAMIESPHPYPNNYDNAWSITEPGAGQIRVHFSQIDTEDNWDYVYIYDDNYNLITTPNPAHSVIYTPWVDGDTIRIGLVSDSSITDYGFTIDDTEVQEAPPPVPTDKYAIIVGINDYQHISGLNFCVNDAMDWKEYLIGEGYTISYFLTDSNATEANITDAIQDIVAQAESDDTIAFVFSGHGGGWGGDSYLCCYDCGGGTQGGLTDLELQQAFSGFDGQLFIFLDSCSSGGMGEVVTADPNSDNRYMTTTCDANGSGYDESSYRNGAWTYWFLVKGLDGGQSGRDDMEGNFNWAQSNYPYSGPDAPQRFDGDPINLFYLSH